MSTAFNDMLQGLNEVDTFLAGQEAGFRVHIPEAIDVKLIRTRLRMTQARFSTAFGFSLDAIKHWEGGRRTPEVSARAYLTVIAKDASAVMSALGVPAASRKGVRSRSRSGERAKIKVRKVTLPKKDGSLVAQA